jgi:hypothetical protein
MNLDKLRQRATMIILLTSLTTLTACADNNQQGGGRQQGGQHSGPPAEAYTACEGQEEGAIVSIKSPKGETLNATCTMIDGKLAAVPEGLKQR